MTDYEFQLKILEQTLWRGVLKPSMFNLEIKKEARRLLKALRKDFVLTAKGEH